MAYITSQGEELLKGAVRIDPDPEGASGILCACCSTVISCSQFEAHAGRGSRRAPYDNIFTADGLSLRKVRRVSCARSMEWHPRGPWHAAEGPYRKRLVWFLHVAQYAFVSLKALPHGRALQPEVISGLGSSGCI